MLMDINTDGSVTVVSLHEERLTADIASEFSKSVTEIVNNEPETIIIDLSKVNFMDSSGLGSIMAIRKAASGVCKMKVSSVNNAVMDILKLTRMNQVLDIYESTELAKAA